MSDFNKLTANKRKLIEVSEETFWYALEVLPPIYAKGCFGMGEIYSYSDNKPIIYWFAEIHNEALEKNEFYGYLGTQAEAEKVFAQAKRFASAK